MTSCTECSNVYTTSDQEKWRFIPGMCQSCTEHEFSFAASHGNLKLIKSLVRRGMSLETTIHGETALMLAARNGRVQVAEWLLDHGAHPDTATAWGETALMESAWKGCGPITELLLAHGANAEAQTKWGTTALSEAKSKGHHHIVELLTLNGNFT